MVPAIAEACIGCVNATASYSDREMHAALEVNIPNYANARRALLLVGPPHRPRQIPKATDAFEPRRARRYLLRCMSPLSGTRQKSSSMQRFRQVTELLRRPGRAASTRAFDPKPSSADLGPSQRNIGRGRLEPTLAFPGLIQRHLSSCRTLSLAWRKREVSPGHAACNRESSARKLALAVSYRGDTMVFTVADARSGWPEANGGSGSYSRPSWIA